MPETIGVKFIETPRDLIILKLAGTYLTVSCDSCGGIGFHPLDAIKVEGRVLGSFLARVALMETLSVNAKPLACSLTLPINPGSALKEVLAGVQGEFKAAGLTGKVRFILSTEKSFPVRQTGAGITVLGFARKLKIGKVKGGDLLVAVGRPCVGREVLKAETKNQIANLKDLGKLLKMSFVHEVIPVGSKGILHEARVLAKGSGLRFKPFPRLAVDVRKPAGPSTVILAAVDKNSVENLEKTISKPLAKVGVFA
ncbi:MAG: alpha-ribazole kinase [Candidatus Hecatellaceae archaeon]